jgi:hypothetical protein
MVRFAFSIGDVSAKVNGQKPHFVDSSFLIAYFTPLTSAQKRFGSIAGRFIFPGTCCSVMFLLR